MILVIPWLIWVRLKPGKQLDIAFNPLDPSENLPAGKTYVIWCGVKIVYHAFLVAGFTLLVSLILSMIP